MIGRRRFLKLMGVTTASAPLADSQEGLIQVADYIRVFGLPKHVEPAVRERARYIHCLDPDIACKRSWSLNVKIQEQRQRNYQRMIEGYKASGAYERAQRKFFELAGFKWQW